MTIIVTVSESTAAQSTVTINTGVSTASLADLIAVRNQAAASAETATTKAGEASTSANMASAKATEANASAAIATNRAADADASAAIATNRAADADASATIAAASESNTATIKNAVEATAAEVAINATTAATKADEAITAAAAAATSAADAQAGALAVSSALVFKGGWDASTGAYPTPTLNPERSDYYRITVGGTLTGTQGSITTTAGDYLHWDMYLDQWFKIDAVDAVTSVAGRTGDVSLTKSDVGLANVPNVDATNASNISTGTISDARLPASITSDITGNAATATTATSAAKLTTARTITLTGDVTGTTTFDGSADVSLIATVADDSHNHIIANVDGLQTALDAKLPSASYTAADVLTKVKTVDGIASGLDADLLDGQEGAFYQDASNINAGTIGDAYLPATISSDITGNAATATKLATSRNITLTGDVTGTATFDGTLDASIAVTVADDSHNHVITNVDGLQVALDSKLNAASYTAADVLAKLQTVDGTDSRLDADLLDGQHGSYYRNADNINAGTVAKERLPGTIDSSTTGTAANAELLDGLDSTRFSRSAVGQLNNYDNWDAFTAHGTYKVHSPNFTGNANAPPSTYGYGILQVEVSDIGVENRTNQVYYPHSYDIDKYIYQRMFNVSGWTAWCKIWRGGTGPNSGLQASKVSDIAPIGDGRNLVEGQMAGDDFFRLRVYSDVYDGGAVELATADIGNVPIYVRQYTGDFANVARTLTMLDENGVTRVPIGVDLTGSYYGSGWSGQISNGIMNGNADGSNATSNNMRIASWWGVGISPSCPGLAVPQWEYSHWFDARTGNGGMRGTLAQWSDVRLKTDIETIPAALAKVNSLRGVTYARKDSGERCTGMIAQEVQAVLPEAVVVGDDENKTLSVTYGNMVGLLVEAIKELTAKVEALEAKVGG